jgi:hypothetical protein
MNDDRLPFVLVGVDRNVSFFNEVTNYQELNFGQIIGNHDKTSSHELSKLVWPIVEEKLQGIRDQKLGELKKAVSDRLVATDINDIWRKAFDGRGRHLLVEENFHYPARLDETGQHLSPAEDATTPDVIDDAVDEIIEAVISMGGDVTFMEDDQLKDHQGIALILRYRS